MQNKLLLENYWEIRARELKNSTSSFFEAVRCLLKDGN